MSAKNFGDENGIKSIPLYAIGYPYFANVGSVRWRAIIWGMPKSTRIRLKAYERQRYGAGAGYRPPASASLASEAPGLPGCYLFLDQNGVVIYVGKAKNLRSRVGSYFTKAASEELRTSELVTRISQVQYQPTTSELDALLLEYQLIKQYKPWYNSQMKPERSRPYLRISNDDPYPALHAVDEPLDDDADYIDCFGNKDDIARSLMLLCELWGLPQCGASEFREVASPCMYHTLHGCMSPCSKKADVNQYKAAITEVKMLLNGFEVSKLAELRNDLTQAVAELDFEFATVLKRQIESLEHLQNKGRKRYHLPDSGRALILIRPYREQSFSAFLINDGSTVARIDFNSDSTHTHEQQSIEIIAALNTTTTLPDSDWLPNCLIEVAADKQFLLLSNDNDIASAEILEALLNWLKC